MGEIGKQRQLNQMEQYGVRTWFLQDEMDFEILIEALINGQGLSFFLIWLK